MTKINGLLFVLLFPILQLHAQPGKIDTDRPDQTESVATVPRNYFQAEFGFNKENTFGENYNLLHPTALLKYGLTKFEFRLEIESKSSYEHLIPEPKWTSGIEPVVVGFKAALCEEKKWRPKTSVIVHMGLPFLATKNFRPDHLISSFRFTFQNSITDHMGIGYNIGAEWDGYTSTPAWIYTFSPGFDLGEKWYAYIEAFGSVMKNEKPVHNIDGGLAYYISPDTKLDISAGAGISGTAPKSYFAIGFSFRVNAKKK